MSSMTFAGEQVLERAAEVYVEDGVDDGIERGVDVAEPDDAVDDVMVRCLGALSAEWKDDVHEEERQPTDDERSHDDSHRARGTTLLCQRDALFLLDEVMHLSAHRDAPRRIVPPPSFSPLSLNVCGGCAWGLNGGSGGRCGVHITRG